MPAGGYDLLRQFDAIFIGALGDPRVPDNRHARDILLHTRFELDLFVNYRPVRLLDARLCPLKDRGPDDVNFVVFRENTEGLYVGIGGRFKAGTDDEIAIQEEVNTYKGVHRIIRHAFEFAHSRGLTRVCMADKSNAMTDGHALWQRVFREVAASYPAITPTHYYIDALAMYMVLDPAQFQVIVTNNLFGDIITDLGATFQGGLGMAASGNLHPGRTSMFEPVHGSAPKFAGRNIANPIGAIGSMALLLETLGLVEEAAAVDRAVHGRRARAAGDDRHRRHARHARSGAGDCRRDSQAFRVERDIMTRTSSFSAAPVRRWPTTTASSRTSRRSTSGAIASRAALERTGVAASAVDHVVFGNVLQTSADAVYGARHVGLKAGLPIEVPALTVNRLCGSGIQAAVSGGQMIQLGEADVVLAGGTESMSQAPHVIRGLRSGLRLGQGELEDTLWSALLDTHCGCTMAVTAENCAAKYGISREEQDRYAVRSQQLADRAVSGRQAARRDRADRDQDAQGRRDLRRRRPPCVPSRRWRGWRGCRLSSARTAASPPATLRALSTAPRRCCSRRRPGWRGTG